MAVTHRLYRTERIPNGRGGFAAALAPYIKEVCFDEQGALVPEWQRSSFHHWTMPPDFDFYYCHAWCESSIHAQCEADPNVTALTGEFSSASALRASFSGALGADFNRLSNIIEGDGIPLDDVNGASTLAQLMRRVARHHYVAQSMWGDNFKPASLLLKKSVPLAHRKNQVPQFVRDRLAARLAGQLQAAELNNIAELDWLEANATADLWMAANGVNTSSIPGNATMREIRRRANNEATLSAGRFPMRLHNLEL